MDMVYDTIHNIQSKNQLHTIIQPSQQAITQKKTSYNFSYAYNPSGTASVRPHAPNHIGVRTYTYDLDGNQTGWTHDQNGTRRDIVWDDENRIQSIADNGQTKTYKYDDQGNRMIKRGPQGETVYVNQFFTQRPGANGTKHVYAGTSRIASKLLRQDTPNSNPNGNTPFEKDIFFYHPDHIGSTNYVTDLNGKLYEHLEYFPFGESWVEENSNTQRTPYLFSAKELDEETGLYYFGARYYDPRTSVWQSADPILSKYLPSGDQNKDRNLSGMGGVYKPLNLGLYSYGHANPVKFFDPDGKETQIIVTKDYVIDFSVFGRRIKLGEYGSHAAVRVDNPSGTPTLYDPAGSYNPTDREGGPARGSGDLIEGKAADLESYVKYQNSLGSDVEVLRFATTPGQEKEIANRAEKQGGAAPCYCAKSTSSVISGVGPFDKIKSTFLPGTLSDKLKEIKPAPKAELREAPQE